MFPSPQHSSNLEIRVKDLETGTEAAISGGEPFPFRPEISPDGTLIAYTADRPGQVYMAWVEHGTPRVIVESRNSMAWDWSPDNKRLLFARSSAGRLKIYLLEVSSGHESLFLSNSDYDLFQAKFSPDGRWVILIGCDSARSATDCRLFIVPLKRDGTPELDNWIGIDHPSHWDDKPRWSPDGKVLYFLSDRDGHFCLWAQRLDRDTKRPIGAPFPLYHFHNSRLAMINVGTAALEIEVARDKPVMGVGELTGNIWSLKR